MNTLKKQIEILKFINKVEKQEYTYIVRKVVPFI